METLIDITMYEDSYRGYNLRRFIEVVRSMETHIEVTMYGTLCIVYNVWRLI